MRQMIPFALLALASLAWAAEPANDCDTQLSKCVKAANCAKTPDSKACKACKSAHDKCVANAATLRAAPKKTTKR